MAERKTTEDVIEMARKYGLAPQKLFVIISTPVEGWDPIQANADAHLDHLRATEGDGTLFGAGPLCTEDGFCDGEGMFIVRADSMDQAHEIAARDPMHKSGARTYRIRPWVMNEGTITLSVIFSNQKGQLR